MLSAVQGENLIVNGGFEQNAENWPKDKGMRSSKVNSWSEPFSDRAGLLQPNTFGDTYVWPIHSFSTFEVRR
jgi:hypothetical protein